MIRDGEREFTTSGWVHPDWRRRGLGRAMLRSAEAQLRDRAAAEEAAGETRAAHLGRGASTRRSGPSPSSSRRATARCAGSSRWSGRSTRRSRIVASRTASSCGRSPRTSPGRSCAADAEAFQDHWGAHETTEEDVRRMLGDPDNDLSLWIVAWAGDEVVGSVINRIYPTDNAASGIRRGWLDRVSVRRPWRRIGRRVGPHRGVPARAPRPGHGGRRARRRLGQPDRRPRRLRAPRVPARQALGGLPQAALSSPARRSGGVGHRSGPSDDDGSAGPRLGSDDDRPPRPRRPTPDAAPGGPPGGRRRPARRVGRGRRGQVAAGRRRAARCSPRRTSGTDGSTASRSGPTRTRSSPRSASARVSIRTSGRTAATGSRTTSSATTTSKKYVTFQYRSESDRGPYPIPKSVKREAGSDRHVLIVDKDACKLYELFAASKSATGHWSAGSGAIWNLRLNRLRPDGWTSADAAGLPILPGPRPLRRGRRRGDRPRAPVHRPDDALGAHLPGPPRCRRRQRPGPPADGPAGPPQGERRPVRVLGARTG